MKRPLLAAALIAVAVCMAGCGAPGPAQPATALTYQQAALRAELAAETAFNVAATAEVDAKAAGILKGEKAVKADAVKRQAYTALLAIRAAYNQGQKPDISALLSITNQLLTLAGKPTAAPPDLSGVPVLAPPTR